MQKKSGLNPVKLRHLRLRKKVVGSSSRPRLCVHFSSKNIYDVKSVVFDRGGWQFHGKVKALADAAREAGLNF